MGKSQAHIHGRTGINLAKSLRLCVQDDPKQNQYHSTDFKEAMERHGILVRDGSVYRVADDFGKGNLSDLNNLGLALFSAPKIMNEYLANLVQKVGWNWFVTVTATNPLAEFKDGYAPYGYIGEEYHVNPAEEYQFDPDGTNFMTRAIPDVEVAYHVTNREKQFKVTIHRPLLKQAFSGASWEGYGRLLDEILASLDNGNNMKEELYTRQLWGMAVKNQRIVTQQVVDPVASPDNARVFIQRVRELSKAITRPSTAYNAFMLYPENVGKQPRIVSTLPEDIRIIMTDTVEAYSDVNVLAAAFHLDRTDFQRRIITVAQFEDEDGVPMPNVKAIIQDRAFIRIKDLLDEDENTSWFNPSGLYYNYFLTRFQMYGISPFANAVALVTPQQP